jgi:hypothetical protein
MRIATIRDTHANQPIITPMSPAVAAPIATNKMPELIIKTRDPKILEKRMMKVIVHLVENRQRS